MHADVTPGDVHRLRTRVDAYPRIKLAHLPTPLEEMPRLRAQLGGPRLLVKRDDCTGLAMGGNKVRKLEFALAAAVAAGADCVVCGGVVQSNTSRQVAAACAKLGLECHLGVMHGRVPATGDSAYNVSGNILLNRLYGAVIHDIPWSADRNHQLHRIRDELSAAGRHPYLVPYGCSDDLGAIGYVRMLLELLDQCASAGVSPTHLVHASGSGGTQAGIVAAIAALGHPMRCIGIDIDREPERVREDVLRLARQVVTRLGAEERWHDDLVEVAPGFAGPMYGVPDEATLDAIRLAARCEGLALDPVYSGKGLRGLMGLIRAGRFQEDDVIVWLHTGGTPGLFAYADTMNAAVQTL